MRNITGTTLIGLILSAGLLGGCSSRHQALLPNSDPHLRRSGSEFAADAKLRHPYPAHLPHAGEAAGRAQIAYMLNRLELVNLDSGDWHDVEVWVNQSYVVHLPVIERNGRLKRINFVSLMDAEGKHFPLRRAFVEQVELVKDGHRYSVTAMVAH